MKTFVKTRDGGYNVILERGSIDKFALLTGITGKTLIVTDTGVPQSYARRIASQLEKPYIYTVEQGEKSKSLDCFGKILSFMLENNFTRSDSVVACGGGVVGDLAGFCAASYMRGVKFRNFPTTVLAQVDSSVGGKTAVNLDGVKNPVGAFYQPSAVVIDPDVLKTLGRRQTAAGLAEAVKTSLTGDASLFEKFEKEDIYENTDEIIFRSIEIKKNVVQLDEKENGLRMILNFGHTIGHGIESLGLGLYHGECVALGMLPMCSDAVRKRLIPVLERLGLPTRLDFDEEKVMAAIAHDKKTTGELINAVTVSKVGEYRINKMSAGEIRQRLCVLKGENG
ncbi:MAG: 3-dehydroquinate synthase [Clostridia bacterium]|nr:3-dehydroquinate synthase [Clostridia bacterium]